MGEKPTEASEMAFAPVATIAEAPSTTTAVAPPEPEQVRAVVEPIEDVEESAPVAVEESPADVIEEEELAAAEEEAPIAAVEEVPALAEPVASPLAEVNVSVDPATGKTSVKFSYICLHCGSPRDVDSGRYVSDCPTCGQTAESGNSQLDTVARGDHIPTFDRSSSFYP